MTRLEFFVTLRAGLKKLPPDEIENAVRYYTEYLDDAGEENEEKALSDLGDPVKIAQQINAEYMVRDIALYHPGKGGSSGEEKGQRKSGFWAVWIAILAVFASPIALPIAIGIAAVAFSLLLAVCCVFLGFFIAVAGVFVAGFACLLSGIGVMGVHPPTGVALIGAGFIAQGISLFMLVPLWWLVRITFSGIARLISRPVTRRSVR